MFFSLLRYLYGGAVRILAVKTATPAENRPNRGMK